MPTVVGAWSWGRYRLTGRARTLVPLLLIVAVGAALRLAVNNERQFAPQDETMYLNYTRILAERGLEGYPAVVRLWVDGGPGNWGLPPPLRWGYLTVTAAFCAVAGECDYGHLAWVSTLASILIVAATYLVARTFLGERAGLLAAAMSVTSPVILGLGRRALQDEFFALMVLLSLWAFAWALLTSDARRDFRRYALAAAILTWTFGTKEAFLAFYPAFVVLLVERWRARGPRLADAMLLAFPPVLFVVVFALLAHGIASFFDVGSIIGNQQVVSSDYARQYEAGPPHVLLLSFLVLAPIVTVLAVSWIGRVATARVDRGEYVLAVVILAVLGMFAFLPKDVRYVAGIDPLLRTLTVPMLLSLSSIAGRFAVPALGAFLVANALVELAIF